MLADLERSFLRPNSNSASETELASSEPNKSAMSGRELPPSPMTFGDLFRQFHADPAKVRAPKTQMIYDNLLTIGASVWGEDRQLGSIDRSACRELMEVLRWLPSNPLYHHQSK